MNLQVWVNCYAMHTTNRKDGNSGGLALASCRLAKTDSGNYFAYFFAIAKTEGAESPSI